MSVPGYDVAVTDLYDHGVAFADIRLTADQCDHLTLSIPSVPAGRGGVRGLVGHPSVLQLLHHKRLGGYLWSIVGRDLVAIRATLFDRTIESSWRVQWHQDRVISVRERMAVPGYSPWSVKSGVPHVEPPTSVLEQMLAVRVYLDASGPENGPLRVIPGSHEWGKVAEKDLQCRAAAATSVEVHVPKGALLLMRPLLVHASTRWLMPTHRRVLHIEFAPAEAISPLQWQTSIHLRRAA